MIEDFIVAELTIWAAMIALLPVAAAIGITLVKYQADREVRERLRSPARGVAKRSRPLLPSQASRSATNLRTRRHA